MLFESPSKLESYVTALSNGKYMHVIWSSTIKQSTDLSIITDLLYLSLYALDWANAAKSSLPLVVSGTLLPADTPNGSPSSISS